MARKSNKISLKEFKAWLQGVEELQEDTWAPNRQQWELIRAKIDCVTDPKPEKVIVQEAHAPAGPMQYAPPAMGAPQGFVPPPATGGFPQGDVQMSPAAKNMLNPQAGANAKTPDTDGTDVNATSSFA